MHNAMTNNAIINVSFIPHDQPSCMHFDASAGTHTLIPALLSAQDFGPRLDLHVSSSPKHGLHLWNMEMVLT